MSGVTGLNHIAEVPWRWASPRATTSSSFYYGSVDSSGDIYYLPTGNGAGPHAVYKLRGADGTLLWTSTSRPRPTYANFDGSDHLVVFESSAVYVVAGSTSTLPPCSWIQRLDANTGAELWWLNGTANVASLHIAAADGSVLAATFSNGTVSLIDASSGTITASHDIRDQVADRLVGVFTTLAADYDTLLLSTPAPTTTTTTTPNASALRGANAEPSRIIALSVREGVVRWNVPDAASSRFPGVPHTPAAGSAFAGYVYTATSGNYGDGQGTAALSVADGSVLWAKPTSGVVGVGSAVAARGDDQGWQWLFQYPSSGTTATVLAVSLKDGSALTNPVYLTPPSFSSNIAVSSDGTCAYVFGSGTWGALSPDGTQLLAFCMDPADRSRIALEYAVSVSGVSFPGRYQLATGPAPGQLTLFHEGGVLVLQPFTLRPPPPIPPPPAPPVSLPTGEIIALVMGRPADRCSGGAAVNTSLSAAALWRAADSSVRWTPGPLFTAIDAIIAGMSCSSSDNTIAIDALGRRAWAKFNCMNVGTGRGLLLVAELSLGAQRGDAPSIVSVCYARRVNKLFFSRAVNDTAPWFLDLGAEFEKPFYTLAVPPLPSVPATTIPGCTMARIGANRSPLFPALGVLSVDERDPLSSTTVLYAAGPMPTGIRLLGVAVPNGTCVVDVTLPCDSAVCASKYLGFAGVVGGVAAVVGSAPYYTDWPDAPTLLQTLIVRGGPTAPTTFTGQFSTAAPRLPIRTASMGAVLADPAPQPRAPSNSGAARLWVQGLDTGSTACTNSTTPATLRSVAVVQADEPAGSILVTDVTTTACPLPVGSACYSLAIGHLQVFATK